MNIINAYFSPSNKTKEIVQLISNNLGQVVKNIDLLKDIEETIIEKDQLLIVGLPNFCGRIPPISAKRLEKIKSNNAKAIIVNVFGNRGIDDALLETYDILKTNGFVIVSAGAFVAQHSIFTKIASERPDDLDKAKIEEFSNLTLKKLEKNEINELKVMGNRPYKKYTGVPFTAKANNKCNNCGLCVDVCPVSAIDKNEPSKTDSKKCISCTACINICPQKARTFGVVASVANPAFMIKCAKRKEPVWFV